MMLIDTISLVAYIQNTPRVDEDIIRHLANGGLIQYKDSTGIWRPGFCKNAPIRRKPEYLPKASSTPQKYVYHLGRLYRAPTDGSDLYQPFEPSEAPVKLTDDDHRLDLVSVEPVKVYLQRFIAAYAPRLIRFKGEWYQPAGVRKDGDHVPRVAFTTFWLYYKDFFECVTDEGVKVSNYFIGIN